MPQSTAIVACIDGSDYAAAACDAAIWVADRLEWPLTFVNVVSRPRHATSTDYSGQIGLGSREHLLEELVELDEKRSRLVRERGRDLLDVASQRATHAGLPAPTRVQRNGELVDALDHVGTDIKLLVLGKRGGGSAADSEQLGSNLEQVIRSMDCPILITPEQFVTPGRLLIAYDGSANGQRIIERVAAVARLLSDTEIHLVHVGESDDKRRTQLEEAASHLQATGAEVITAVLSGEVEPALHEYQHEQQLELVIMGAHGHSRLRRLLLGSTTTDMIRRTEVPLLIIR